MNSSGNHLQEGRDRRAFTLTDLLVVVAVVTVLATVALASQGSSGHVLRAQCAGNLRQIGEALNVYAADCDDYLPVCGLPNGQNPWQTYEACRVDPGTGTLTRGFVSLGLLVRTRAVHDPKPLYCPAQYLELFTYDYYVKNPLGWPSTPVGSGDDNVRTGYNYFPQLRAMEKVGAFLELPKLSFQNQQLEVGFGNFVAPVRMSEVNPRKSIVTDLVNSTVTLSHLDYGEAAGVNALFPDGNVVFQNARTNPEAFDSKVWAMMGSDLPRFRIVMNGWEQ